MNLGNIFDTKSNTTGRYEVFETLQESGYCMVERILSSGQHTPEGTWLEQERNEWVILLKGSAGLEFESGGKFDMIPGDYLMIPSNTRHRVTYTSTSEESVWLAFHFD